MALQERGDLLRLAEWFASAIEHEEWDIAGAAADLAERVSRGGVAPVYVGQSDGICGALARTGYRCRLRVMGDEELCSVHSQMLHRLEGSGL